MNAIRLPTNVGVTSAEGFRVSTGEEGTVSYGPYISLDAGRYIAGFYIRRIGPSEPRNIILDVMEDGSEILATKSFTHQVLFEDLASFVYLPFEASQPTLRTEVRLHVSEGVLVELQDLVLFNADPRVWSGT